MWTTEDITRAIGSRPLRAPSRDGSDDVVCERVVIDSREVGPGDIFVCIKGDRTDGHLYIEQALNSGAKTIIAARDYGGLAKLQNDFPEHAALFAAEDTTRALGELAAYHRKRLRGLVIGVTGSSGKTSAKEMLHAMGRELVGDEFVTATRGNLNNHWGLPLSVLAARPADKLVILEMGMNHAGEIAYLSRIARPDLALITSISEAHIEFFDSILGIARAKLEILEGMQGGALAFPALASGLDIAQERAAETGIELLEFRADASTRTGVFGMEFAFGDDTVRNGYYFNPVMASNLLGVLTILARGGFERESLLRAAARVKPATGRRFQVFRRRHESGEQILVDDSYNANESSFGEALRALRALLPSGTLALAAGPMAELGETGGPAHGRLGELAAELGYEPVALVESPHMNEFAAAYEKAHEKIRGEGVPSGVILRASDAHALLKLIEPRMAGGGFDGILVKGSRSSRMDIVADGIKELGYV